MNAHKSNHIIYGICLLWFGVLFGVSFIATPAKFLVAELDLVTAIKIGRSTFHVYHYFELVMASITGLVIFLLRVEKSVWAYFALLGISLLVQYAFVQPLVEQNSDNLFYGTNIRSNPNAHLYYIFCDVLKAVLLIGFLPAITFINKGHQR